MNKKDKMIDMIVKNNLQAYRYTWYDNEIFKDPTRNDIKKIKSMIEASEFIDASERAADAEDWNRRLSKNDIHGLDWLVSK